MRLVTYDAGAGPRVGALEDESVVDLGFDGDMVAFIAAGAPARRAATPSRGPACSPRCARARMRDFLAFEGHLKGALGRLGRPIPDEWYDVPAYYKGMPDTVIGPERGDPLAELDRAPRPRARAGLRDRPRAAATWPPTDAAEVIFGYTIWNDVSARDVQARELPIGMGPAKAKDWDGSNVLGPCLVTADELDAGDLAMSVRVNGETWGEDTSASMHWRFGDMIAYASRSQTLRPGRADRLGHGRGRLGPRARPRARAGRPGRARDRGNRRAAATESERRERPEWLTWCRRCGARTRARRSGSPGSSRR